MKVRARPGQMQDRIKLLARVKSLSHKDIADQIMALFRLRQVPAWRIHGHLGQTPGISDIIGVWPKTGRPSGSRRRPGSIRGQFLAVEVKAGEDKLSEPQEAFLEAVRQAGGLAVVARSLEDVLILWREEEP